MITVERQSGVLIGAVRRQPTSTPGKVDFAWQLAVGQALARGTTVALSAPACCTVTVDDARWNAEIERARVLRAASSGLLGGRQVAAVTHHGPLTPMP